MNNSLALRARILSSEPLRRTPAGVAVLSFQVEHTSSQREADQPREIMLEMDCVVVGDKAEMLEKTLPGEELELNGFLANRSKKSQWVVFHVTEFELK